MTTYYLSPRRRMLRQYREMDAQRPDVQIPVDVVADGDDYLLTAYVPGVNAEDLNIEVIEDMVTIKGEFISNYDEETRILRRERPTGKFSRTLRLPSTLNPAGANAEIINGVLNLVVPKAEEAKAKQIKVKVK